MSIDEFHSTRWGCGMFAIYKGEKYPVAACAFDEALVGLGDEALGTDDPTWVRCENIELA